MTNYRMMINGLVEEMNNRLEELRAELPVAEDKFEEVNRLFEEDEDNEEVEAEREELMDRVDFIRYSISTLEERLVSLNTLETELIEIM